MFGGRLEFLLAFQTLEGRGVNSFPISVEFVAIQEIVLLLIL